MSPVSPGRGRYRRNPSAGAGLPSACWTSLVQTGQVGIPRMNREWFGDSDAAEDMIPVCSPRSEISRPQQES